MECDAIPFCSPDLIAFGDRRRKAAWDGDNSVSMVSNALLLKRWRGTR
jgi:hypothetical protein